jgi:hypothetical protein
VIGLGLIDSRVTVLVADHARMSVVRTPGEGMPVAVFPIITPKMSLFALR